MQRLTLEKFLTLLQSTVSLAITLTFSLAFLGCSHQAVRDAHLSRMDSLLTAKRILLPNGWSLSPAGTAESLGDFPINIVYSPTHKVFAVTHGGQSVQELMLVNPEGKVVSTTEVAKLWYGLAFHPTKPQLYASSGNDNSILIYNITGNKLVKKDSIVLGNPWPKDKISPTGITYDAQRNKLYVTTKEDTSLYVIHEPTRQITKIALGAESYASVLSPDGQRLYVSLWGGSRIAVIDLTNNQKSVIPLSSHPNEMILTQSGRYLFAAQANDNVVSVIDTKSLKVIETLKTSLDPSAPAGSTPNGLALSEDESTLYVANADNNCLAVFDVSHPGTSKSLGFIPTGWYPTAVRELGGKLYVINGKGGKSLANPRGPNPYTRRTDSTQYIAGLFKGTLSIVEDPGPEELKLYTRAVYRNTPYSKAIAAQAEGQEGNPIPRKAGEKSPIKYVFYIIKENRTYDQVLGDLPKGDGDSSLCLFPQSVTPNQHAIAQQFVLLDRFFVNAEVSADGHNWSTAAYANDYVEKTWPTSYGGRGGSYDYEGSRKIAFPKAGFIWDYCQRAGISYRSYGEFVYSGKTGLKSLEGHFDADFPSYNLNIPDTIRFEKWRQDFDSLVSINAVPQFNTLRLPNDHTAGTRIGMPTPRAMVAENDLAVGRFLEHLSKSKIWKEAVVFILEDDAQNGPDHVDAHRSPGYVAGPYVKRNAVISRMYTTASMLRTMELILGLPPMSQYDAAATPMYECFTSTPDFTPFESISAIYNIKEKNTRIDELSRTSQLLDLDRMDAAPDLVFSDVIWRSIKGIHSKTPAPVRGAFLTYVAESEDDDEEESKN